MKFSHYCIFIIPSGKIDIGIKFSFTRNKNFEDFDFGNSIASLNVSLGDDGSEFKEIAFNQNLSLLDFNKSRRTVHFMYSRLKLDVAELLDDGETSTHMYGSYYYKFFLDTLTFSEAKKACL